MNFIKSIFLLSALFLTTCIHTSSEENKSSDGISRQNFIQKFTQLQMSEEQIEPKGQVIYAAISSDYDTTTEYYSSGDNVTTILTGPDGVREIYIADSGKTHKIFFAREQK